MATVMGSGHIHCMRRGAGALAALRAGAALALAAALVPQPANARATANAQATIQTPGSISKVYDMDFGKIAQNTGGGTVVLSAASAAACTTTGGLIRVGACKAAEFSVFGKKNWKVRLKKTSTGSITLNGPAGATMQLTNLTYTSNGLAVANGAVGWNLGNYDITSNTGFAQFWLGGTLHVGPAQAAGVYTGTVVVQVQFN